MKTNMDIIKEQIRNTAKGEQARGMIKYGNHHSGHEAYAVLKEEADELNTDNSQLTLYIRSLWSYVKCDVEDKNTLELLASIEYIAENLTCEAIQTLAMIYKYRDYLLRKNSSQAKSEPCADSNNSNSSDESDNSTQLEMKLEYQTGFSEEKQYTDAVEKLCFSRNPNKNVSGVASCDRVLDRCPLLDLNNGDCKHLSKDKEEAEKQKKAVYNY